jgi:peptidyl-prolyl cis-trans isomerase B (cyclophilin B)
MPYTVANFMDLVNKRFYSGLTFHRSELWLIQGGDPTSTGSGGPGYTIKLEVNRRLKNVKGAIAMARLKEPNTGGSQFYILKMDAGALNGKYAVFGSVIKGMNVVNKIKAGDKIIGIRKII